MGRIHRRDLMIGTEKDADADFDEVFDLASVCGGVSSRQSIPIQIALTLPYIIRCYLPM